MRHWGMWPAWRNIGADILCSIQLTWQIVWSYHGFFIVKFDDWGETKCLIKVLCSEKSDNTSLLLNCRILQWEGHDVFTYILPHQINETQNYLLPFSFMHGQPCMRTTMLGSPIGSSSYIISNFSQFGSYITYLFISTPLVTSFKVI